jgi:hypothetical protein
MITIPKLDHHRRPSRCRRSTLFGRVRKAASAGISAIGIVASTSVPVLAQSPPAPQSELSIWQGVDTGILNRLAAAVADAPDGAVGNNRNGFIQVGLQNQSSWIVPKALVEKDSTDLARAVRIIAYGFAHELPNGGFQFSVGSSGSAPTELSKEGSAAFFLADVGESLALVKESTWFQSAPETASERSTLAKLMPSYHLAVDDLVAHASTLASDQGAVNRTFICSNAFGFAGTLLNDSAAAAQSRSFVDNAIARQLPDGTFPESGGFDSSYQGVSIFLSQVRFANLQDGAERARLWHAIELAVTRERSAIAGDGTVSTEGNTRISEGGEKLFGVSKTVDGRAVTLGLLFYGILAGASDAKAQAIQVAHKYHVIAPQ